MKNKLVLEEIDAAKGGVTDAEHDLTRLLREVQSAPRAEKTTISEALHAAFEKLREARNHLVTLEKLIKAGDD